MHAGAAAQGKWRPDATGRSTQPLYRLHVERDTRRESHSQKNRMGLSLVYCPVGERKTEWSSIREESRSRERMSTAIPGSLLMQTNRVAISRLAGIRASSCMHIVAYAVRLYFTALT